MSAPRVLLIDNIDSFTFNIADLVHRVLGVPATVWRHDREMAAAERWWLDFEAIIVGPGPGRPDVPADMGLSLVALQQRDVPVLGVCLGHQGIAAHAGWNVAQMPEPHHGQVAAVHHDGQGLFAGVPSPFAAVRYHSLDVTDDAAPRADSTLSAIAWSRPDNCVMGLADAQARQWGVQFHPESVLTEHGDTIVANFFAVAGVDASTPEYPEQPGHSRASSTHEGAHRSRNESGSVASVVSLRVQRLDGQVFAWDLHAGLERRRTTGGDQRGDAFIAPGASDASVWLDSSDNHGISIMADASGPLGYTLAHRVGEGSTLSTGEHLPGTVWDNVATLLARMRLASDDSDQSLPFDFRPGFVGYFGYELKAETDAAVSNKHQAQTPDAWLMFADRAVVIDHATRDVYALAVLNDEVAAEQESWINSVAALVHELSSAHDVEPVVPAPTTIAAVSTESQDAVVGAAARHTAADYQDLVARSQQQIRAGETYEVCLTNHVHWPSSADERATYRRLRTISPGPFGAWLRCGEFSVLSSSPERFVSLSSEGVVRAEPIKGTRPRDIDPARDAELATELAADSKERAENLMIVDLLRNDLHRVCVPRSVTVPELFAVRSWATVHQLVSTVTGQVSAGLGPADVLRSCFPGGSMTGAPKVRTMQILEDLEAGPRGVYSGAIGWVGLNGAMDTSIVIRTIVMTSNVTTFGIGGAITALSDPAEEYAETLVKARAVAHALTDV
ncbi:MAG: aminodeoxychorismate synthase component I [Ornithinimicrobium sp.]